MFNNRGERWVQAMHWQQPGIFPLFSALKQATPVPGSNSRLAAYEGRSIAGVDVDMLVYFGASIFWRSAVHDWAPLGKPVRRLRLDRYEEELRLYLAGGDFPVHAAMVVATSSELDRDTNQMVSAPVLKRKLSGWWCYRFSYYGIEFKLILGRTMPAAFLAMCAARSGLLLMSPKVDEINARDAHALFTSAKARGTLEELDRRD